MFELDGDGARAERLRERGRARSRPSSSASGSPSDGCYAIGLDGDKRPGSGLTSNQGHLLWANVVSDERAALHPRRADGRATCSRGWGVRTLAAEPSGLQPGRATTPGSVWPHDSALIAFGLRRYGFDEDFTLIFEGLLEAASRFNDYRLPELFAGFAARGVRRAGAVPGRVPAAGVGGRLDPVPAQVGARPSPDALEKRLGIVRPSLPRWLERVDVTGLADRRTPGSTCASSARASR